MRCIRILEIISGFAIEGPLGGIERFGIELSRALDQTQFAPIICGLWQYNMPFEHNRITSLREEGIDVFVAAEWDDNSSYRSFWRALQNVLKTMEGEGVDIIHSHCSSGDIIALLLKGILKAKVVMRTVHIEREWSNCPLRRLILTHMLYPWMFDVEVGVSQKVVDNLNRRLIARLLGKRAIRIYNAINLQRFEDLQVDRLAKRRGLGLKREALVVGAVGRLTKQKGYAILLDAAALVLKKLPQTRFLIIGSGELQGELKRHAQSLGINTKVIFTGARKDIEELIAVMDVFVSSSLWEGLPTAVLESMAAKVPVVATRVSGSSELINHGRTGLLVPPGDPKSLADGIMLLLTKRQKAISMGIEAYRYLKEKFSMENIAKQYATLYTSCLNEESP